MATGRSTAELADPVKKAMSGTPASVTVKQLDGLRRKLSRNAEAAYNGDNPNLGDAYDGAAKSVRKFIENAHPEYKPAMDVYAAHSKMLKGFETAAAGKRISDVSKPDLRRDLRTNEGRVGMMLGELHRQREVVGKSPSSAINAAKDYGAEGKLTRQANPLDPTASQPGTITENLSPTSAADLADASRAQYEVLQRATKAGGIDVAKAGEGLDSPNTLSYGLALATGGGGPVTKAHFMSNLLHGFPTQINDKVAKNMTEMLFSGDPAQSQAALNALRRLGVTDQVLRSWALPVAAGATSARGGEGSEPSTMIDVGSGKIIPYEPDGPQSSNEYETKRQEMLAGQPPAVQKVLPRIEMAESGGNANLVSSKGARNVMQVMPYTGPDAAGYAGVPFDEEKFNSDPEYGRLLGTAYFLWLLPQFEGNIPKALAAYNDGIGDAMKYVNKPNWLSHAPDETQKYVRRILG